MKIQNLSEEDTDRRSKLLRASMLYIVLFSLGIVIYFSSSNNFKNNVFLEQIFGNYSATNKATTNNVPADIKKELDKFATYKASDEDNLPACESYVDKANYNCPVNEINNQFCAAKQVTCDDACKAKAKDGAVSGWLKLQLCENRNNKNFGCSSGKYTAGLVDTIAVENFPLLDFLAQTEMAQSNATTGSTTKGATVAGAASDSYSYTQPYCFYNMFRNFAKIDNNEEDPLTFGTNYTGPIQFSNNTCGVVVPYEKLGTAAACWGPHWDNYNDPFKADVKQFYQQYWASPSTGGTSQPDTWWSTILDFFKSIFGSSIVDTSDLVPVKNLTGKDVVCANLPGGGIERFNESKNITSTETFEVTRKIFEFSKKEICQMQINKSSDIMGVESCTVGGFKFMLNDAFLNKKITKQTCSKKDPITKKCIAWKCENAQSICGVDYDCEDNNPGATYLDAYYNCYSEGGYKDADSVGESQYGLHYKVEKPGFDTVNLPNGRKLLKETYNMDQLNSMVGYDKEAYVKYGENIGIKLKTKRSLNDINWCDGFCLYGKDLKTKPDKIGFDPVSGLKTSLKDYISLSTDTPYNVKYTGMIMGKDNLFPASPVKETVSRSEVYYFYPYMGNIPMMLERMSVYFSNYANTDTANTLIQWFKGESPFPTLNNKNLANLMLKTCAETKNGSNRKDCIMLTGRTQTITTPSPTPTQVKPTVTIPPNVTYPPTVIPCGNGIDVSHWQGNIDWNRVKNDGEIEFAFIKSSEGITFTDDQFAANWRNSKAAGVKRGAYHFFRPEVDGVAQANYFYNELLKNGNDGDFVMAIDVEQPYNCNQSGCVIVPITEELRAKSAINIKLMVDRVTELQGGRKPIIYTSKSEWQKMTGNPSWANDSYPLWVAQWNNSGVTYYPSGWTNYVIWQYSANGVVPGISSSSVDMDKTNPNNPLFPSTKCNTPSTSISKSSNVSLASSQTNTTANSTGNVLGLSASQSRLTDVDSLTTYLAANIYTPNNTTLCKASEVTTGSGNPNPTVTYFPPGPTDPPSTPKPSKPACTPKPLPTSSGGQCMLDNVKGKIATPIDGGGNTGYYQGHMGVDYSNGALGTPVYAVSSGQVVYVRNLNLNDSIYFGGSPETVANQCKKSSQNNHNCDCDWCSNSDVSTPNATIWNSYGNVVVIKHNDGVTLYAHLKSGSITVKEGDCVLRNQQIGQMGNVGWSTGAHLHFEIRNTGCPYYSEACITNTNDTSMFDKKLSTPRTPSGDPIPPDSCF